VLARTTAANATFRLHNLVWGLYNPSWLLNNFSAAELTALLTKHVTTTVARYSPNRRIIAVDVVNEAVSDGGVNEPMFKPSKPWYPAVPDYVAIAFETAAKARAPGSAMKLFYNDYDIWHLGPKSDRVYSMIASLLKRGVAVEGLGMQMHVSSCLQLYPFNRSSFRTNLIRFRRLSIDVHVTELDAWLIPLICSEQQQAQLYSDVLSTCLEYLPGTTARLCQSVESWEFNDATSWINHLKPLVDTAPLPFRGDFTPKPAYDAMLNVLKQAP
jgi:endo-1,4-beta-xylanase